jgi:hypothetical protein
MTKTKGTGAREKDADILVELAADASFFHSADGTGYGDISNNGHREVWAIKSSRFRQWLARLFYEATGGAAGNQAMESALNVLCARAQFDGPERDVHLRVAEHNGAIFLDLTDEEWRVVVIDGQGWRVEGVSDVRFRRASGMRALPVPQSGGSIDQLRRFLNVSTDDEFILVVAWALAVLRPHGPYPILAISGEQGTAKSTFTAILRALLDPNTSALRALPGGERDLFIAANNAHVLAFDNVSALPAWTSDTLCRIATGAGFAVRELYSDQEEVLFSATRPVILNGIPEIVDRPDLADRAIFLTLTPIGDEVRMSERELWDQFEKERPEILGALLDAMSHGIRMLPSTHLSSSPRMADFALWIAACEGALWRPGQFMAAYLGNRDEAVETMIEANVVALTLQAFAQKERKWIGTATALLTALDGVALESVRRSKEWPKTARLLSVEVRRAATPLRKIGVNIIRYRTPDRARDRFISISLAEPASASSTRSETEDLQYAHIPEADVADDETASPAGVRSSTAPANDNAKPDAADDADAEIGAPGHEWTEQEWSDHFEERAGIIEHDGGRSRLEAEHQAYEECVRRWLTGSDRDHGGSFGRADAVAALAAFGIVRPGLVQPEASELDWSA